MIKKDDMLKPIVAADPAFYPKLEAEYVKRLGGKEYVYAALGVLLDHIHELHEAGEIGRIDKIFDVVERWHTEGDHYVKEAATIGFLENMQNFGNREEFVQWLGPHSKRWWEKLDRFWNGDIRALKE